MALQKMSSNNSKKTILKKLEYPEKILIILREAIGGNQEFRDFLFKSQYKELGFFCYALLNDVKSRKWLLENQFAHLLATEIKQSYPVDKVKLSVDKPRYTKKLGLREIRVEVER